MFFWFVCFITDVYLNFFDRTITDLVKHNLVLSVDVQKTERKKIDMVQACESYLS